MALILVTLNEDSPAQSIRRAFGHAPSVDVRQRDIIS